MRRGRERGAEPRRRMLPLVIAVSVVVILAIGVVAALSTTGRPAAIATPTVAATATATAAPYRELSSAEVEQLPQARYDAVIGGLIAYTGDASPIKKSYTVSRDTPVYGADRVTAVARLSAKDFANAATITVAVALDGEWTQILTPARVSLPSRTDGAAPAQSSGWVRTSELVPVESLTTRVVIAVKSHTLSIVEGSTILDSFSVGVGTKDTPTPVQVTGYLQQRYLDARQGQVRYPIQLTSLHATMQDEPYAGTSGGLIGIHYDPERGGAVSHGCVRLSAKAIQAVNKLPLGTPVSIVP